MVVEMTPKEAKVILDVMATADGGCPYCVSELFDVFSKHFPEYNYLVDAKTVEYKLKERLS
jgi:hypothetical protein